MGKRHERKGEFIQPLFCSVYVYGQSTFKPFSETRLRHHLAGEGLFIYLFWSTKRNKNGYKSILHSHNFVCYLEMKKSGHIITEVSCLVLLTFNSYQCT